ncbi:hypothetical protein KKF81_05190 [Candidatus Micrarchaeota archaeon]|nr:hypothetical protein [Candidatus Micrarchaeota archaeon]MBU1166321.1 hypothetical protein [Candidatus Micrarchaeota archaeon]MBU1886427.1 hypothetical protein [Candidatus Micrarchaeota archaeon]
MIGNLDYLKESITSGYGFIKKNTKVLFTELLKITVLSEVIAFIPGLLLFILLSISNPDNVMGIINGTEEFSIVDANPTSLFLGGSILLIVFVVCVLLSSVVESVALNIIDNMTKKQHTNLKKQIVENAIPIMRLKILVTVGSLICIAPVIISVMLGPDAALLLCGSIIIGAIAYVALMFFVQFSTLEIVIRKTDFISAIKNSAKLVRANILVTLLLNIIIIIIMILATGIVQLVGIGFDAVTKTSQSIADNIVINVLFFIMILIVSMVISTLTNLITLPIQYYFWKDLKK